MIVWIKRLVVPPIFEDEEQARIADPLHAIMLTLLLVSAGVITWQLTFYGRPTDFAQRFALLSNATTAIVSMGLLFLLRRGYVSLVGALLSSVIWAIVTSWIYSSGYLNGPIVTVYFLVIAIGGLTLGRRAAIAFGLACVLTVVGAFYAQINRVIPAPQGVVSSFDLIVLVSTLSTGVLLLRFVMRSTAKAFERARSNERALAESNSELLSANQELQREISERMRAEAELRKYQEHLKELVEERTNELALATRQAEDARIAAEVANRAKSEFLANMSHELRTPLNAILGFSQMMIHEPELMPAHREKLGIISHSGEHLLTLINSVLDLSRIEAGRMTLNEQSFDLHRLLNDLEDMVRLKAEDKDLQLLCDRAPDLPQYVYADKDKLRRVLVNLLDNAINFTEEGGVTLRIAVTSDKLQIAAPESKIRNLRFEIEDTGPGIAPEELDDLFEAFVQTQIGRARGEAGLGLSLSRKLVQLMGGEITVSSPSLALPSPAEESAPSKAKEAGRGAGSILKFDVPVELAGRPEIRRLKSEISPRRVIALEPDQPCYRILVVDDSEVNRLLLVQLLSSLGSPPLGFEIREASSGQQALEAWENWDPHLIWLDMQMPGMDGYEVAQQIKTTAKGQDAVIVALTAGVLEQERTRALAAGCDDFLPKPVWSGEVFDMMHRHLGVRYVYEEQEDAASLGMGEQGGRTRHPPIIPADLVALPPDLLANLEQATVRTNITWIAVLIDEIRPRNAALADALANLADDFAYGKILNAIQQAREQL